MELINNDLVGFDSITLQNQMRNININVSDMSVQTETRKFADKCNYSKETRDIAIQAPDTIESISIDKISSSIKKLSTQFDLNEVEHSSSFIEYDNKTQILTSSENTENEILDFSRLLNEYEKKG